MCQFNPFSLKKIFFSPRNTIFEHNRSRPLWCTLSKQSQVFELHYIWRRYWNYILGWQILGSVFERSFLCGHHNTSIVELQHNFLLHEVQLARYYIEIFTEVFSLCFSCNNIDVLVTGTMSVLYLMIFVITKGAGWGAHIDSWMSVITIKTDIGVLSGMLALSFFIHNIIITIMKNNRQQENNVRRYNCIRVKQIHIPSIL